MKKYGGKKVRRSTTWEAVQWRLDRVGFNGSPRTIPSQVDVKAANRSICDCPLDW